MMLNGNRTKSKRQRSPRDLYITPEELAFTAVRQFIVDENFDVLAPFILDAGCGTGVWGRASMEFVIPVHYENIYPLMYGIDIQPNIEERTKHLYDSVYTEDFLQYEIPSIVDVVLGNPPFSLAEEFIRHAIMGIKDGCYVYFFLRLSFLESIKRGNGLFKELPLKRVYVCSRRPSFFSTKGDGKHTTDTLAYAMFLWQKGWTGTTELSWLNWDYVNKHL